jgi:predicted ATPase
MLNELAGLGFVSRVSLVSERVGNFEAYPFSLPAVMALRGGIALDPRITFFVGENGTGKSTLVEAIAIASGFNAEGGSQNFRFATRASESELHGCIRLARTASRPQTGYFLRAESFFNVASNIEELDRVPSLGRPVIDSYGGRSLHEQSHGEAFYSLVENRFGPHGLYILDEPEAALSPRGQLLLLRKFHDLAKNGSQLIIATHSPLLMALPNSLIYQLSENGIARTRFEDTDHFRTSRGFLCDPTTALTELLTPKTQ